MNQYKTYYTEDVKGKDGIIRPITKVRYTKPCPQCGSDMHVANHKKGTIRSPRLVKWECSDQRICKHSEREESDQERIRRINNA